MIVFADASLYWSDTVGGGDDVAGCGLYGGGVYAVVGYGVLEYGGGV